MEAKNSKIDADLKKLIEKAADFHGHLGPFLVIGVRMGNAAQRVLSSYEENSKLQITAKIPFLTPFSCIIDGIQVTTKCTVGNQKLKIENSEKEIAASFKPQNSHDSLELLVNPHVIEELTNKFSAGASSEELAWKIASMKENKLFKIKSKKP